MRALVTGAARGIGAAIAQRLRDDGVAVVTLDAAPGCDIQADVRELPFPDVGPIDACIANAAVTTTIAPAHAMTPEQWQLDIDVNLTGAFRTIQACLGGMRERRSGRIVVVSSGAATAGLPGQAAYAASKAGLLGLVRTLAGENVRHGITANAVLPGLVATDAVAAMPAEVLAAASAAWAPRGTLVTPEEVAATVAFLVSPAASGISGQAIAVDGGAGVETGSLGSPRRGQ